MLLLRHTTLLILGCLIVPWDWARADLVDEVNVLIGTTGPKTAYGGVCPWVTPPHGMTHWTPMTQENGISRLPYRSEQKRIVGFMGTHQPTVWMGDYGFFTLMPEVGERKVAVEERGLEIVPGSEQPHPDRYSVDLVESRSGSQKIHVELSSTARCALFSLGFPDTGPARLYLEMGRLSGYEGWVRTSKDGREVVGYNTGRNNIWAGRHMGPELQKFRGYFVIQFEEPVDSFDTWDQTPSTEGKWSPRVFTDGRELKGARVGAFANFSRRWRGDVRVRIGTSFISVEQARDNLRREIPGWDLKEVEARSRMAWNEALGRLELTGGTPDARTIFYTAMYHASLFPRAQDEYGRYFSAFDEKIHEGVAYNDYSMWDTFRALHPLLQLIAPEHVSPMIRSLLQMYEEGGWLPKWPNPAETNIMIGTPADAIIADAYVNGFRDYDLKTAYAAVYRDAMVAPDGDDHKRWADRAEWTGYEARAGLIYYKTLGYIPADRTNESVSCTLEDAYEDYCVARLAQGLGKKVDVRIFTQRSRNYRNLYNPKTGFMQPRLADGRFFEGDPNSLQAFTEGSPWTYLFCVMQDIPGLVALMGRNTFIARLDENFRGGHYAYDNEPENHYPYLYDWVGQPWKTQQILTKAITENYRNTPDGISGNDDCGQMSAWYLFTALGFYPVTPASGEYALGRPFFPKITLHLGYPKAHEFTVIARHLSPENNYVASVRLDGRTLSRPFLSFAELQSGHSLEFEMSAKPPHQD